MLLPHIPSRRLLAAILLAAALPAQDDSVLVHSAVLPVPVARLWQDLSTAEGLVKIWGASKAEVDLRTGGAIKVHFDPAGELGDPNTVVHEVRLAVPGRLLAVQSRAPAHATDEVKRILARASSVMILEPLGPDRTRYRVYGTGWAEGSLARQGRALFLDGNRLTEAKMREAYRDARDRAAPEGARMLLDRLRGGSWIGELAGEGGGAAGQKLRAELEQGLGGTLELTRWAGAVGALKPTVQVTLYPDTEAQAFAFLLRQDDGGIARGFVRAAGDTVQLIGELHSGDAAPERLFVELQFDGDDGLIVRHGEREVFLHRVAVVPAEWRGRQ